MILQTVLQMSYYGRVSENNPLRSFILRVYAEDLDSGENGRIVYSLSGLHSDRFDLDPHSGKAENFEIFSLSEYLSEYLSLI